MLAAAQREYQQDEIQPEVLRILEPGNEFLQEVVDMRNLRMLDSLLEQSRSI